MEQIDSRVQQVIALLERERETPPSLRQLAAAVRLSPSQLTRLFRTVVGESPIHYGRRVRLDYAHTLITESYLSVKAVMAAAGWTDPSHFSRDFKARYGMSPRTLRKSLRQQSTAADDGRIDEP